jgi:glycosyltransferase involved in cell wall biosynthesis
MQAKYPLISVVLSTYNGSEYIKEQLDSVLAQTYPNIEIVIRDDGSKDDTVEVLLEYQKTNENIRIIINEENLGYIKSFERAMRLSKGNFIALCDQDDFWLPEKLQLLYENIDDHLLIYHDSELVDSNLNSYGIYFSDKKRMRSFDSCLVFVTDNCIPGHTTLIKRKLLDLAVPFPATIPHDHWLAFIAAMNGGVKFLDKPLVKYRNHDTNVFGLIRSKEEKEKRKQEEKKGWSHRERKLDNLKIFYDKCYPYLTKEREVIKKLITAYKGFSLRSNFVRMTTFFKYRDELLGAKKRNEFRKFIYCFKMFVKTH